MAYIDSYYEQSIEYAMLGKGFVVTGRKGRPLQVGE